MFNIIKFITITLFLSLYSRSCIALPESIRGKTAHWYRSRREITTTFFGTGMINGNNPGFIEGGRVNALRAEYSFFLLDESYSDAKYPASVVTAIGILCGFNKGAILLESIAGTSLNLSKIETQLCNLLEKKYLESFNGKTITLTPKIIGDYKITPIIMNNGRRFLLIE